MNLTMPVAPFVCYYTHLAVAFFKERAGDHTAGLLHCYQLDKVVTARCRYLYMYKYSFNTTETCTNEKTYPVITIHTFLLE